MTPFMLAHDISSRWEGAGMEVEVPVNNTLYFCQIAVWQNGI